MKQYVIAIYHGKIKIYDLLKMSSDDLTYFIKFKFCKDNKLYYVHYTDKSFSDNGLEYFSNIQDFYLGKIIFMTNDLYELFEKYQELKNKTTCKTCKKCNK